jgi:hypothetical protein
MNDKDKQECVQAIDSFVSGSGGERDWDDFISVRSKNPDIQRIKSYCGETRCLYPGGKNGGSLSWIRHGNTLTYHCTMIEDGQHLLNCLRYVDLNMVRCGVVKHPGQWRLCSYDELAGTRQRYRLIDIDRLLQSLDLDNAAELIRLHSDGIRDQIERRDLARAPHWTEALAVGGKDFMTQARSQYPQRRSFVETGVGTEVNHGTWMLKEAPAAYTAGFGQELPV